MWKGKTTKDSVLCISRYKETANHIHFLAVFEKKPYEIDSLSMTAIEQVDALTIYHNKFQRESNDYKSLIKKRILKLTGPVGYNEFDGYIYIFKKKNKQKFRSVQAPEYFEALHENTILNEPKNDMEADSISDAVANSFFEQQ